MARITAIMSGKRRVFFVSPGWLEAAKIIFGIQADEEVIQAASQESLTTLEKDLKKSRGKKVFFLFLPEYHICQEILTKAGYEEGKDFLNANIFLSPANGMPLSSYQFIENM